MSEPWPDRYQQLLRALAAATIALARREPRCGDLPADEWPYAAQPALAARELLEEALIADARFTGDPALACPPLPQHVVLARAARSASELIKAAAHSTSPSQWVGEPTAFAPHGHGDRAHQVLRTAASVFRAAHSRAQQPGLSPSQARLAATHLGGLGQAIDTLVTAAAGMNGLQRQAELLAEAKIDIAAMAGAAQLPVAQPADTSGRTGPERAPPAPPPEEEHRSSVGSCRPPA